ncbi:MAG: aminotransferase class V-fold PLP-dependent enzyme [Candidatus Aenigmarchaeota archaeon]|nr:aminotransferase class V-fold PLP-dependent enzyme [Candidatus Aenigmarchaeota archaeon]
MTTTNLEKTRFDFPAINQKINGRPVIYFDNACMSLRPKQVIQAMNEYYEQYPACAGRSMHKFASKVNEKMSEARDIMANFIGAKKSEEIIFTRNTTEGLNLVANSLNFKHGDVVVTSDREHNSNLIPWQIISKTKKIVHKVVRSKKDMTFDLEIFEKNMNKNVKLVSMVHTSNLDGYTLPVEKIIRIAHDYGSLVMLDCAQSVPHKKIDVKKLNVDFVAFSGHKMVGPSGIGILYGKYHLLEEMNPFLVGGDTVSNTTYDSHTLLKPPEKFEAGLQNYAGNIGLGAAAKYLDNIGRENIEKHEIEINRFITQNITDIPSLSILGPEEVEQRGGIFSFNIKDIHFHDVAMMLDNIANIMIRSGQHCVHSWFNANKIEGSARASLYFYNTKEEAKIFVEKLKEISKLR